MEPPGKSPKVFSFLRMIPVVSVFHNERTFSHFSCFDSVVSPFPKLKEDLTITDNLIYLHSKVIKEEKGLHFILKFTF